MNLNYPPLRPQKPPYLLGLLGFIPLVGFFAGIAMIILAVTKFKDKWMIVIGIACMLMTIAFYTALFYIGFKSKIGKGLWAQHSQMQLNNLVRHVEYYKLEHDEYPKNLQDLLKENKEGIIIFDPIKVVGTTGSNLFNYENRGDTYLLFSSGVDEIAHTEDDLYPQVTANKNIGWRRK
jgi:hypothetical protein